MGDYSVPPEIRSLRPTGTQIKRQGNHFYVYETSSTKRKVLQQDGTCIWKTVTKSGKCIGSITVKDGFVPNKNTIVRDEITVLEYGDYAFALKSSNTLKLLNSTFNAKDANQIYVAAVITVVNGFTYMKDMKGLYDESVLAFEFPDVHVGAAALSRLYENLGRRAGKATSFQQTLIDKASRKIAFDGHVIAYTSEKNDLSEYGYKAAKLNSPQINWMTAYDVETKSPLANEMFNGSIPDKTSIQQFFDRFSFSDTLFIVDRGFNTADNKQLMSKDGNSYIVPMIRGRNDYEAVYNRINIDKRRNFIYDKDGYSSLICYQEFVDEDRRYIAYIDTTRQSAERKTYVKKLQEGKKGYSEKGLISSEKDFGLFLLETSDMKKAPRDIFCDYKSRWGIETFYDYVDNIIDFNALYQQDYCKMQGLSFVIQVAGMIYHELKEIAGKHNESLKTAMRILKGLKLSKDRDVWKLKNATKEKIGLAEKIGISLAPQFDFRQPKK